LKKNLAFLIFSLSFVCLLDAQNTSRVFGVVRDIDTDDPVEFVTVYLKGSNNSVETNAYGEYALDVPAGKDLTLVFSRIGYLETEFKLMAMAASRKRNINISMAAQVSDVDVIIRSSKIEDVGMVKEEVTEFIKLPTASGNFESILPHIALGVSSGTGGELSSQYNVRGGNYDENLIYVNDFEIFRPMLIRSSQQEGLSFPNPDLIRDVSFSSGGFESKYGDKLSSVLDVRYKRPEKFAASASASFLGASAHMEGSKKLGPNAYNKLRYLAGARYKTTRYLLGSLDVQGEYIPNFADLQAFLTYDFTKELQLGVLANYNLSLYDFTPTERVSASGLFTQVLQLTTLFEGQERTGFENSMGGLSLTYIPERDRNPMFIKLLASRYDNYESENFDILGFYRLSQVEFDLEGEGSLDEVAVLGVGTQHLFARNRLESQVTTVQLRGGLELQSENERSNNFIQWGIKYQEELIDDRLSEWERIDSAGYSIPFSESEVLLNEVIKSENSISSYRIQGFLQNSYSFTSPDRFEVKMTAGARVHHWSFNGETNISPRFQLFYRPLSTDRDITFKLAGGLYVQPAFYRELRNLQGIVNPNLTAQRSTHFVAGFSYDFDWLQRSRKKFRLITEAYYKKLDNLVSYDIDNVRIRYSGVNDASGYVAGLDLRVNGEFVPGAESWVNLSFLTARESLNGVQHLKRSFGATEDEEVDFVPRPTDQAFNINIYFQDYLPQNKDFKMNLNLAYGSGLPFGQRGNNTIYRNTFRFKAYQRVDIGFSYQIWDESKRDAKPYHLFRFTRNSWISLEVFNLLQIANVSSNVWIKTVGNQQYAIPNFLTSRRINLRFRTEF
jgi:hypothetical protein